MIKSFILSLLFPIVFIKILPLLYRFKNPIINSGKLILSLFLFVLPSALLGLLPHLILDCN